MKTSQIVFTEKNKAELLEVNVPMPKAGEVVIRTAYTALSCGTEKANITGDPVVSIASDENSPVVFPRYSGYSLAGEVTAVGKGVTSVAPGDRVAAAWTLHKGINVVPEKNVFLLPDKVSFESACLFHIATFSLAALRKTSLEIGQSCIVMGLGVLGLLAVILAKAAGAVPVIAADPIKSRREKALAYGADYALDPTSDDFAETVNKLTCGGADTAVEVTGLGAGLNGVLDCMAPLGKVALLGCTRDKNFTVDYYRKVHGKGVSLVGAHTLARNMFESAEDNFTLADDMDTLIKLCSGRRFSLDGFADEIHSPKECSEVYSRLINDKAFPPIVLFDWSNVK